MEKDINRIERSMKDFIGNKSFDIGEESFNGYKGKIHKIITSDNEFGLKLYKTGNEFFDEGKTRENLELQEFLGKLGISTKVHRTLNGDIYSNNDSALFDFVETRKDFGNNEKDFEKIDNTIRRFRGEISDLKLDNYDSTWGYLERHYGFLDELLKDGVIDKTLFYIIGDFYDRAKLIEEKRNENIHGDAHRGNFLYDESKDKCLIIDFDDIVEYNQIMDIVTMLFNVEDTSYIFETYKDIYSKQEILDFAYYFQIRRSCYSMFNKRNKENIERNLNKIQMHLENYKNGVEQFTF